MNRCARWIAGIGLLGLSACGDSAIVKQCIEEGKSAEWCRCSDRVMRSELSNEEYRLAEKAAETEGKAMEEALQEKGAGFALRFAGKMAGTAMKISERCQGK
ncbi:MAG: hypothetical protein ACLFWF_12525, partial [Alphaproteobacteria bacterium]